MNKNVFIVEDNRHQLEQVTELVRAHSSLELYSSSRNGREALEILRETEVDLLLLDINLPEMTGVELLENLEDPPYIIFITAYDEYAIRAFELGAIDYILKPVTDERFNKSIQRFLSLTGKKTSGQKPVKKLGLSFKSRGNSYFISYGDIVYFTASGKGTIVHTGEKDFDASSLMKDVEAKLPSSSFIRVHRKYIVNSAFISYTRKDRDSMYLVLKDDDDTQVPVSKSYRETIMKLLHGRVRQQ